MADYQLGETVVVTATITNAAGAAANPATSTKITIKNSADTTIIDAAAMTLGVTGSFSYNFQTAALTVLGYHDYEIVATNGSLITIHNEGLNIVVRI